MRRKSLKMVVRVQDGGHSARRGFGPGTLTAAQYDFHSVGLCVGSVVDEGALERRADGRFNAHAYVTASCR